MRYTKAISVPAAVIIGWFAPCYIIAASSQQVYTLSRQCNSGKQSACSELAKVAVNDKDAHVRGLAATKLSDQSLRAKIAVEDDDAGVRAAAVAGLTDRALLANISIDDRDASVRASAAAKLASDLVDAATRGDASVVQSLLGRGTAADSKDKDGVTALMWASKNGYAQVARTLLDKGASVNVKSNGRTPLMLASEQGHVEVVRMLLEKGADINAMNVNPDYVQMPNGAIAYPGPTTTAPEIASRFPGSVIRHGDIETALSLASKNGHQDVRTLLVSGGAK
jgi:hypothetical protein